MSDDEEKARRDKLEAYYNKYKPTSKAAKSREANDLRIRAEDSSQQYQIAEHISRITRSPGQEE